MKYGTTHNLAMSILLTHLFSVPSSLKNHNKILPFKFLRNFHISIIYSRIHNFKQINNMQGSRFKIYSNLQEFYLVSLLRLSLCTKHILNINLQGQKLNKDHKSNHHEEFQEFRSIFNEQIHYIWNKILLNRHLRSPDHCKPNMQCLL